MVILTSAEVIKTDLSGTKTSSLETKTLDSEMPTKSSAIRTSLKAIEILSIKAMAIPLSETITVSLLVAGIPSLVREML